uniref:Retrotransposon gag domain-containing protein n=1 Tax=Tanacetum cinerariifolium TaxID=118510 RepID=A0A699IB91_TANCI|nr:hypothetical protein [Tanacetum cinerariifolium]
MVDNRTMEEILQAPTEGYGDAIVVPDILAENFEIKTGLLSLIQANQFHDLKNEITRFTQKFEETFGEAWERFKEMLRQCPHHRFSELPQLDTFYNGLNEHEQDSLNAPVAFKVSTTFSGNSSSKDARVDKFMDTISNLVETFNKKMTTPATIKAVKETCVICEGAHPYYDCISTDSNILSACATTGTYNQGNTGFHPQVATNYRMNQNSQPGFPLVQNNQNRYNKNQNKGNNYQAPIQHPQVELLNEFSKYKQITKTSIRAMQNQIDNFKAKLKNEIHSSMQNQINNDTASTSGLGSLPSNTVANPRGDLKAITTRSGVFYDEPLIPPHTSSLPKVVERVPEDTAFSSGTGSLPSNIVPNPRADLKVITTQSGVTLAGPSVSPLLSKEVDREPETIMHQVLTGSTNNVPPLVVQPSPNSTSSTPISFPKMPEVTKDTVQPSTKNIQPLVAQTQVPIDEPIVAPKPKLTIPYPSRANK